MDFAQLPSDIFEELCRALLYAHLGAPAPLRLRHRELIDPGADILVTAPDGQRWIAEAKSPRRPVQSPSIVQTWLADLNRVADREKADQKVLMLAWELSDRLRREISQSAAGVKIFDALEIHRLLERFPAIKKAYAAFLGAHAEMEQAVAAMAQAGRIIESPIAQVDPVPDTLIAELDKVIPGKQGWRGFEDVCVRIISFSFAPHLRSPRLQHSSDDGLDRRDAIFPIIGGTPFWDGIKHGFASRMLVAEFKNYSDPIAQTEVESLQQYLLPKARRTFGILCSRHQPSESALLARRRAWVIAETIILFLSDGDLKEMVRMKAEGGDPAAILDAQMDEFFIGLSA